MNAKRSNAVYRCTLKDPARDFAQDSIQIEDECQVDERRIYSSASLLSKNKYSRSGECLSYSIEERQCGTSNKDERRQRV